MAKLVPCQNCGGLLPRPACASNRPLSCPHCDTSSGSVILSRGEPVSRDDLASRRHVVSCGDVASRGAVAVASGERPENAGSPLRRRGRTLPTRLTQVAIGGSLAMTLMACYGAPQAYYNDPGYPDPQLDGDGDGFGAADDCDDRAPEIHPGAPDVAGDQIDSDCDGSDAPKQQFAEPPSSNQQLQVAEPPAGSVVPE